MRLKIPVVDALALLDLAVGAARSAGELLLERFAGPAAGVTSKSSPTDLVSDADLSSQELLLGLIRAERPDDGVLSEEGTDDASRTGLRWVIDPLDGTTNFLFGIPVWSISVAVEDSQGGVAGVVHDPNRGETFTAARASGAHLNGEPIGVRDKGHAPTALVGTGFSYDAGARAVQADVLRRVLPEVRDIRRAGSLAIDLCYVACGRMDGFFESVVGHYDKAAGELIVAEAGGTVSYFDSPEKGAVGVIAAGPSLHAQLEALVLGGASQAKEVPQRT